MLGPAQQRHQGHHPARGAQGPSRRLVDIEAVPPVLPLRESST